MAQKVLIVLADGFEEIEAVTPMDVLRRAELEVTVAGLSGKTVKGAHGVSIEADITLDDYDEIPDLIVLPGGMPGSKNLAKSKKVAELVHKINREGKIVSGICAAPALVLAPTGLLNGKRATCYPGFENNFSNAVTFSQDRVVVDGNLVTSRGPGSALEFACELVRQLVGQDKAQELRQGLLVQIPAPTSS